MTTNPNKPAHRSSWLIVGDCFRCGKPYEISVCDDMDGNQLMTCSHEDGCNEPIVQATIVSQHVPRQLRDA